MRRLKSLAACAAALVAQWSSGLRADTDTGQRLDVVFIAAHDAVAFVKAARAGGMASGQQTTLPAPERTEAAVPVRTAIGTPAPSRRGREPATPRTSRRRSEGSSTSASPRQPTRTASATAAANSATDIASAESPASDRRVHYPPFRWDRVPVYAHVGKASDDFTAAELDFLARHFDFITIEKGQAAMKYGNTEDGFVVAAREIRKRNPRAKILFYWNASLDSSAVRWGYKAARTMPADAYLRDSKGRLVLRRGSVPNYDLRRPDVRGWWSDVAKKAVTEYGADGIFADAMGDPSQANLKTLDEQTVIALRAARLALMEETRRKIGPHKLLVYNGLMRENREQLLRVADGAMIEHFGHFANGSSKEQIAEAIATVQAVGRTGKIVLVKAWPGFSYREREAMKKPRSELIRLARERITFPLACFLVAAQPYSYFCYTWGYREKLGTFEWYPEFDKPLGPPRGDAIRAGWTFRREFAHASVFVDLESRAARIEWRAER